MTDVLFWYSNITGTFETIEFVGSLEDCEEYNVETEGSYIALSITECPKSASRAWRTKWRSIMIFFLSQGI